jgi:hypothetical protein
MKIRVYKTLVRPETWTLTAKDGSNLHVFERQILRKIFGSVNIAYIWRIRNNMEVDKSVEGADIVRYVKAQRIMAGAYPKNGPNKTN